MRYYFNMGRLIEQAVNQVIGAVNSPTFHQMRTDLENGLRQAANGFQSAKSPVPPVQKKRVSPAGILFTVFGSLGLLWGLILALAMYLPALFCSIPLLLAGGILLAIGVSRLKLNSRFSRYCELIGNASFCTVAELSGVSGKSVSATARDLRRMIRLGMFPYARLDSMGTTLMLDEETYQQYLKALEAMQRREAEGTVPSHSTGNSELDEAISEGRVYLKQINDANDRIPGEEISEQIDRLAKITAKIFACVEQSPEKLPEIKKFLRYYLPTTLKLLNAYAEFDAQPVETENIRAAKMEIEKALCTIETAFSNLLDSLYDDQILDISTDISVLESMFQKEGLTDHQEKE